MRGADETRDMLVTPGVALITGQVEMRGHVQRSKCYGFGGGRLEPLPAARTATITIVAIYKRGLIWKIPRPSHDERRQPAAAEGATLEEQPVCKDLPAFLLKTAAMCVCVCSLF